MLKRFLPLLISVSSVVAITYLALPPLSNAAPPPDCIDWMKADVEKSTQLLTSRYGVEYNVINNHPNLLLGKRTDQAVLVVHGFMASPFEVAQLGKDIHKHGYTVLMPVLSGFGGEGSNPEYARLELWREDIQNAVQTLSRCYDKISLVGFSLGGALVTDYTLQLTQNKKDTSLINAVVLLSPYFAIASAAASGANSAISLVTKKIAIKTLWNATKNTDLRATQQYPHRYSKEMSMNAVSELKRLTKEFKQLSMELKSEIPIYTVYSEFDKTIHLKYMRQFIEGHFKNANFYAIPKSENIPHQIAIPSLNPDFSGLSKRIQFFLNNQTTRLRP